MATRVLIEGRSYPLESFSAEEAATPLAGGDTSGHVGVINVTIQRPDPAVAPNHPLNLIGPSILVDEEVRLEDDRNGLTLGTVSTITRDWGSLIQLQCISRMGKLNVYNIQAQPFVGTLENAFNYYLSLAGVTTNLFVDETIRSRAVTFPGFNGELWFFLKQMAAAQDCDISLVSGVILLRPTRLRTATANRDIQKRHEVSLNSLAQSVEVYQYDNRAITNQLVYPAGGWKDDTEIITVAAGESIEQVLELSSSLTSVVQPTMQTFVAKEHNGSSVYTIVADDGFPVPPALWEANGGRVFVRVNPNTTSLTVSVTAATAIPTDSGEYSKNFSLALASDESGNRYSTLRIMGSGVAYEKEKIVFRTGLTPQQTATEVGLTIDNPFMTNRDQTYSLGTRAARQFSGQVPKISGSVISVNRSGDNGSALYPSYAQVQASLLATGPRTYAQVAALPAYSGRTYSQVEEYWFDTVRNEFENQVFGNVAGVRVFDPLTRRYYRVRNGTVYPDRIEFSEAEDDLTHGDVMSRYAPFTYAQVQAFNQGLTYKQSNLAGMIGVM